MNLADVISMNGVSRENATGPLIEGTVVNAHLGKIVFNTAHVLENYFLSKSVPRKQVEHLITPGNPKNEQALLKALVEIQKDKPDTKVYIRLGLRVKLSTFDFSKHLMK